VAVLDGPGELKHALAPTNDSERLLFRMTLDTPLRLDCQGEVRPGLAAMWSKDSSGRIWTLTLKDDARGYDGSPITASHIVNAWEERQAITRSASLQSAVALDDRKIAVTLTRPQSSVPTILADPAFALAIEPAQRPAGVKFEILSNGDPRDALDHGVDVVVTRDPTVGEYIAGRPEFVNFRLPWTRVYVLMETGDKRGELARAMGAPGVRRSLAPDAVRADARLAEPPFWWNDLTACTPDSTARPRHQSSRVVYPRGDEVARGLAERIVALMGAGRELRTAALEPAEFEAALRDGSERAYVVVLPRQTLAPCRDSSGWPRGASIQPLIDTRAHAIVRRGTPPLSIDWDGTIRVESTRSSSDES
jgi:hypothetical protein